MSSQEFVSALASAEPCHFPCLVSERISIPAIKTYSSWMSVPKALLEQSADQKLGGNYLCAFAFALLLKAYTRANSISCGFLACSELSTEGVPRPSVAAHILRMDFNERITASDNFKNLACTPLTGQNGKMIEMQLRELETQHGFKHFNATLCLTRAAMHGLRLENVFDSEMVLQVESDILAAASGDKTKVNLHFSTSLLDEWCAQNVLSTFESILKAIANNMNCLLKSLNLIGTRDEQLIHSWNARVPPIANQTLNEHFEKVFNDNAEKEAVYTSDGCFTYRELDDLSTVLAIRLMKLGLLRNMVVPICMNKSRWGTCAMNGVWKAGGALTSMDPTHPDDRLFAIIKEVGARIVISDEANASRFKIPGVEVISDLEQLPQLLGAEGLSVSRHDAWRMAGVSPNDLAFVAFTSGSSGKPKGVMHTHNRLTSEHLSYGWNSEYKEARVLQFASYAYIASVGENFRTLLHGSTLCVPSDTERTSNLEGFINQSRSTRSYMTPSLIRTINPENVPSLKYLVVGGEPVDRDLENIWASHVHFIQLYGASEGGFMIKDENNRNYQGKGLRAVGGLSWLVDPQDVNKLVPIGAVGEIVFESHELAAGYLNDPEKTAKTFINPPTWAQNRETARGCRYLRMGDMGRYETDGSISIYGRADTQVKIHGQRVDLQDIESNLRILLPPQSDVVVELVKPFDAPDLPLLTAFCCLALGNVSDRDPGQYPDTRQSISKVQTGLEKYLPLHMVPRAFVILERLPQNSSNKTDRRKLRDDASKLGYKCLIASSFGASKVAPEPPANDKEQTVAELWSRVLCQDIKSIRRGDSFIALGGDSLAAIRLVSAMRSRGLELTTQSILGYPVLKDMAAIARTLHIDLKVADTVTKESHELYSHPPNTEITLKATDFQEWAAFVGALNGGWIDHFAYDFLGKLDLERLKISCKALVETHSILKTVFKLIDGRVYAEIQSGFDPKFEVHQTTIEDLEGACNRIYARDRVSPLGSPIVRFDLIKASLTRHRLIMKLSHAQYDGFCAPMFGQTLKLLYLSQQIPQALSFYEYARIIQDPKTIHDAEVYWQAYLEGSKMPNLVERHNPESPFKNTLDGELKCQVDEPNLQHFDINTAAIIKAAWALTISALAQSTDVVFGDFVGGRQVNIPSIETVVGPCVNFMPVRVKISKSLSNLELLKAIQADLISAIPHESLGFRHIITKCTNWGKNERFSSIVNFIKGTMVNSEKETWMTGDDENGLEVYPIYEEQQHDKTDLWLLCLPGPSDLVSESQTNNRKKALQLHFRYSTRVYQAGVINQIASLYCKVLNSLVTTLDLPVSIPLIPDEARASLVPILD
ncbi:nonribosomal peptide synthetase 6 [Nannizzia gypsea CBS 118893]|uniref:Nonribosomal peptide synthetase 6 n=1 Tax=Arthroderma gypseum (strain ATCC MYA-4604 / CBS 118893) TaxID=535722 RepID=E4UXV9_ARTGP|nr:nonribosomal peptide synthetase 6 [Nannizzia gypsea CBS 118893]EFR02791.1 nonribosomal peptide synthetase 6 [Nannizzia gypsea CBS 118893]